MTTSKMLRFPSPFKSPRGLTPSLRIMLTRVTISRMLSSPSTFISPCKRGSALLFPPMWPWAHAGTKPINKPKYIVGSYLHYV